MDRPIPASAPAAGNGRGYGRLTIFFGYAAGCGKTYAMLQAARAAKDRGVDVVVGYAASGPWPQTTALLQGLEALKPLERKGGRAAPAFDLDGAIRRRPELLVVDDLASVNPSFCRHARRYQDVKELLTAGIDVYTTLSVQHIESLNDLVTAITGLPVEERVPDSVFDRADQVQLVDIEPPDLLRRWETVRPGPPPFFTLENLGTLREMALRRCADRLSLRAERDAIRRNEAPRVDEHVLVCLSSAPSNARIIRTAARMASAFRCPFTALFVETRNFPAMPEADKARLRSNMRLAQQLGAAIETVYGDDVSLQIAEFARLSGVSKIVIGRSTATRKRILSKPTLTERLITLAPNLDIHIIPDAATASTAYRPARVLRRSPSPKLLLQDMGKSLLMLALTTLIAFAFSALRFTEANIITVYVLGVMLTSILVTSWSCSFAVSIVSVLAFNFFFTEPRFTLHAYDSGYPVTFLIMFLAALITGSLATRLKTHVQQTAQAAYRTKTLFDTNQLLQKAKDRDDIIAAVSGQLVKLLDRDVVIYSAQDGVLLPPSIFLARAGAPDPAYLSPDEEAVARWVLKNNKHAGATTDTFSSARCLYLAIRVREHVYGVVGIATGEKPLDAFENSVVLSILGECALAMENQKNAADKEAAAVLAKNEQLRANLLRSISHDLRTPLTSISGNASNLLSNDASFDDATRMQIYTDIYDDAMWLVNLVENLLSVSRIEEGRMNLRLSTELMDEVIAEALRHINRKRTEHHLSVHCDQEYLLARIDARLIVQVIINIVDNAIKYTPAGSSITVTARQQGAFVAVSIADDGPGIPPEDQAHIFDMFYTGSNQVADSRRSLGLGLALCKSIVNAHGGEITVADNAPRGSIFTFTLPAGEVTLHE